jgi:hypothetical protein
MVARCADHRYFRWLSDETLSNISRFGNSDSPSSRLSNMRKSSMRIIFETKAEFLVNGVYNWMKMGELTFNKDFGEIWANSMLLTTLGAIEGMCVPNAA